MRWKCNIKRNPDIGYKRIKTKFLLLPKCIDGEWRWKEYASWEEVFICKDVFCPPDVPANEWSPIRWINE